MFTLVTGNENYSSAVSLADAKTHLRLSTNSFDAYITSLITAATSWVERYLNAPLFTTTWNFYTDIDFDYPMVIPKGLVQSVVSFQYQTADAAWHPISSTTQYDFKIEGGRCKVFLRPFVIIAVPVLYTESPWEVQFTAGFADDPTGLPLQIVQAIKILVGEMFQQTPGYTNIDCVKMFLDPLKFWFSEQF